MRANMYAKHKDTNLPSGSTPSSSSPSLPPTSVTLSSSPSLAIPSSPVESDLDNSSDNSNLVTVIPRTPATYNRKNIRKNTISIQNSLPDDSGSSDSSSLTVVPPEDMFKVQNDNTYSNQSVNTPIDNFENVLNRKVETCQFFVYQKFWNLDVKKCSFKPFCLQKMDDHFRTNHPNVYPRKASCSQGC